MGHSRCQQIAGILSVIFMTTSAAFDYSYTKKYYVMQTRLTWQDAMNVCVGLNGSLGTVYDVGTMSELNVGGIWSAWVGIRLPSNGSMDTLRWSNGELVSYSNWLVGISVPSNAVCVSVQTTEPYAWFRQDCAILNPSLCEVDTGDECTFARTAKSKLIGFDKQVLHQIGDVESCLDICKNNPGFICRSLEYNQSNKTCHLSDENRWLQPWSFASYDPDWDYFHKVCFEAATPPPPPTLATTATTTLSTTTTAATTTTTTTTEIYHVTMADMVCRPAIDLELLVNESKVVRQDVVELQELGVKLKDRNRLLTKNSVPDTRPSARYVGTVAMSIVMSILGAIILLDLVTLVRHVKKCIKDNNCRRKGNEKVVGTCKTKRGTQRKKSFCDEDTHSCIGEWILLPTPSPAKVPETYYDFHGAMASYSSEYGKCYHASTPMSENLTKINNQGCGNDISPY